MPKRYSPTTSYRLVRYLTLTQTAVGSLTVFPLSMSQLLSSAIISAVGLTCKAFLNSGLCSITVNNLPILLDALRCDSRRHSGQGLVTGVCCGVAC